MRPFFSPNFVIFKFYFCPKPFKKSGAALILHLIFFLRE